MINNPLSDVEGYRKLLEKPALARDYGRDDQWYEPMIYNNPLYDVSLTARLLSTAWVRVENKYLDPDRTHIDGVFNSESEAFKLQVSILKMFYDDALSAGTKPLIVIFVDKGSLLKGEKVYEPLLDALKSDKLSYIDLYDVFVEQDVQKNLESWFMGGGHYSPAGNKVVAQYLGKRILAE